MLRHYAPRAPLELITGNAWLRVQALWEQGEKVGWLSFHPFPGLEAPPEITILTMPKDPILYSAQLYATLHQLDAEGITRLVVEAPPESEAWLAVRDRLQRAATPVFIRENS